MRKIDPAVADEIRQLASRETFRLLVAEIERQRGEYLASFARTLGKPGRDAKPIDQREVDYLRGFWAGAEFAVIDLPAKADKAWARHLRKLEEESEPE